MYICMCAHSQLCICGCGIPVFNGMWRQQIIHDMISTMPEYSRVELVTFNVFCKQNTPCR